MAKTKISDPVTTTLGFVVTPSEAERIDAAIREVRRRTGEGLTRSSYLRSLVLAAIPTTDRINL